MITFQEAFNRWAEELKDNKELYSTYQANIAMSFYDAVTNAGIKFPQLHNLANEAAMKFLNLLIVKKE